MSVGVRTRRIARGVLRPLVALASGALMSGAMRVLTAQAPVGPAAAIAAARSAAGDTVNGKHLTVLLLTLGQGDDLYEHYGHNMLWIRDDRVGESLAWNWGVFDFTDPAFLVRFLFLTGMYEVKPYDGQEILGYYAPQNREVIAQELALAPGQRAALDAFVRANFEPANRYYRYDYFLDNCSTRVRDALDIILGGVIRATLEPIKTGMTYRNETLRLNQQNPWLFLGLDMALGKPSDRKLNEWQAAFVPMRLRDELRKVMVPGPDGVPQSLIRSERTIMRTTRSAEPAAINETHAPVGLLIGALIVSLAAISGGISRARAGQSATLVIAIAVHIALGLFACLLVFMWLFTRHAFWAWNPHLLLFTPLSLAVAVSLIRSRTRRAPASWVRIYHFVMAVSALAVSLAVFGGNLGGLETTQKILLIWACAACLVHLALAVALRIAVPGADTGPAPPDAAGLRMAA